MMSAKGGLGSRARAGREFDLQEFEKKIQQDTASLMQCKDPRPEMCIGQYKPVCAIKNTGVQCLTSSCLSIKELTYANACEACSDYKVVEYKQGACSE